MRPVIVVAVIVVVWVAAMSVPPVSDLPRTETPRTLLPKRHYCGSGLTNALKLLCGGVYNTVETIGRLNLSIHICAIKPEPALELFIFISPVRTLAGALFG